MKFPIIAAAAVTAALVAAAPSGAQQAAAPSGGLQILQFKPGFDDLMTMLVQPRHIKLYYAGTAKNWELAAFELRELQSGLRRAGQTIPRYRDNDVAPAVAAMFTPKADALNAAIKEGDATKFAAAYKDLTDACNACHVTMEHPFLIVKVPTMTAASVYPDQEFAPQGK